MTVTLSILIVSWNTRDFLARCLDSVFANPPAVPFEVLVVDNASADGSAAMVRERFPQARLMVNAANIGFAPANNQAFAVSAGEYVLLLNPDTEVKPGALDALPAFLQANSRAAAVGAYLLNPDGTLQTSCYPFPTLSREWWRLLHLDALRPYGVYRMADWDTDTPRPVEVIQGAALLLRKSALQGQPLLDDAYFMYTEEVDLCFRLKRAGGQLYWLPQAKVVHYGGQSTRQVAGDMFLHLYLSKLRFFKKHHGWWKAQLYKLILWQVSLVRLALMPLAWLEPADRRQEHLTLAGHYWQLVKKLMSA